MTDEWKAWLIDYGINRFARAAGREASPTLSGHIDWDGYEALLGQRRPREKALSCIFSRVQDQQGNLPTSEYYAPQALQLTQEVLFPKAALPDAVDTVAIGALFDDFLKDLDELRALLGADVDRFFEGFFHLFYRFAWAVPCDYGEPGISLFEQWKAVSALVCASRGSEKPADTVTLVGGDVPGIQDFVYTISSKGAAKGLRGRSLFLQLLNDAVVRRLLDELKLCATSVVYNAGGNFMLLAPADSEASVKHIEMLVNRRLTEAFQSDTALVLASVQVQKTAEFFTGPGFARAREECWAQVALAKKHPLRSLALAPGGWQQIFTFPDKGTDQACVVCHREVDETNSVEHETTDEAELPPATLAKRPRICFLCKSFAELADDIAFDQLWLTLSPARGKLDKPVLPDDEWHTLLARISGRQYAFQHTPPATHLDALAINAPELLPRQGYGSRLLANVTPVITEAEKQELQAERDEQDDRGHEREKLPNVGDIRSFELLARSAKKMGAVPLIGVLRMDVDGLGAAFSRGMPDMTLSALSSMSAAMERFFGGYLNCMVRAQSQQDLYVIYAGGDDLFIVGAWHHLPVLAETIRNTFQAYTGGHPALSISAGITLEDAHAPLYRAAARARHALDDEAKTYVHADGHRKDALCFLGTTVGWGKDWTLVSTQTTELLSLVNNPDKEQRLPRALLQLIQRIHRIYRRDLVNAQRRARRLGRTPPDPKLFYGRWMWTQVYYLTRLAARSKDNIQHARESVRHLQGQLLSKETVRLSGLAARWAEYLCRGSSFEE